MKHYTILEALKEIELTMPINLDILVSVEGLNDYNNKLKLTFHNRSKTYYVNLDDSTYKII